MSLENVELARRAIDDPTVFFDLLDEDVVFDNTYYSIPDFTGVYHGRQASIDASLSYMGSWEDFRSEAEEIVDAGDSVAIAFRETGRGKQSGAPMEHRYWHVWTFRDGRIIRWTCHKDKAEALAAAEQRSGPPS
jgi:ketosteroid isomerase-like protein